MARTVWDTFRERWVFGFHGNTKSSIAAAARNGFQREGKAGDWLGAGFYFWLDAPARAWQWADAMVALAAAKEPDGKPEEPQVMVARLQCNDYWIDLIEHSPWFARFVEAAAGLQEDGILPDQLDTLDAETLAKPVLHRRDYAVIEEAMNRARRHNIRVDAIRCAFIEGRPVIDRSAIFDKAHVQIAMRNPNIIRARQVLDERE